MTATKSQLYSRGGRERRREVGEEALKSSEPTLEEKSREISDFNCTCGDSSI